MKNRLVYLSYILDSDTPTYGNRNRFECYQTSSISKGDIANDSTIKTTVHIGTHLDMPYHFYENGQTIENFDIDFFRFENVLFLDLKPNNIIIDLELKEKLLSTKEKEKIEAIIVKTGICHNRDEDIFWKENYGFDPSLADFIRKNFPNVRVFGFDSISVSSFSNRALGRSAHKAFLDPEKPILLLEDMDLTLLNSNSEIQKLEIAPLRIANCDGLPCTILAGVV
jgi:arylformamidase